MKKILETKQLEFDKSSFLIDLIQHENGLLYFEILQRIHNEKSVCRAIKINPSTLMEIVNVLLDFQKKIPYRQLNGVLGFTENDKKNVQDRYLKGVSTQDLALQYDTSGAIIEMILRNRGIAVIKDVIIKKKVHTRKKS